METVDADGFITEAHDREALEKAWQLLAPVLKLKGLFSQESGDVNTSETRVEGGSSAPPYALCQLSISEANEFIQAPGAQARGAVCMETFLKTEGLNLHGIRNAGAPSEIKNHRTSVR